MTLAVLLAVSSAHASVTTWDLAAITDPSDGWTSPAAINNADEVALWAFDGTNYNASVWSDGVTEGLGTLGGDMSYPIGINDSGEVIGAAQGPHGKWHGFFWKDGVMTSLDAGLHETAYPSAINSSGQVTGYVYRRGQVTGFTWKNGVMDELPGLGGYTYPVGLNDAGQILYSSWSRRGTSSGTFLYDHGDVSEITTSDDAMTYPIAINAAGEALVQSYGDDGSYSAMIYDDGDLIDLGSGSWGTAIDAEGEVIGGVYSDDGTMTAMFWDADGVAVPLEGLGGMWTWASAMNDVGEIVGYSLDMDGTTQLVVWQDGLIVDLDSSFDGFYAYGINDRGTLLVEGDPSGGWTYAPYVAYEE